MEKKESPAAAVEAFDGVAADLEVSVAAAADWPGLAEAALGFATAQ